MLTIGHEFRLSTQWGRIKTLIEQGLVYRALKPVHWSLENQTALAEAELEYYDRVDPSVPLQPDFFVPENMKPPAGVSLAALNA